MSTTPTTDPLPTPSALAAALSHAVHPSTGAPIPLSTLLAAHNSKPVLTIFIRHFFCGACQSYIRALSSSSLPLLPSASTPVLIIGCGAPHLIAPYTQSTGCKFPIYTDPTGELYEILGMGRPAISLGEKKPNYIETGGVLGFVGSVVKGVVDAVRWGVTGGGDVRRIGGEWVWKGEEVVWCHRMKNTRDHLEVEEVERLLGVIGGGEVEGGKDKGKGPAVE